MDLTSHHSTATFLLVSNGWLESIRPHITLNVCGHGIKTICLNFGALN